MDKLKAVMQNKVSRRKFISGVSAGLGTTAAVSFAAGCGNNNNNPTPTPPPTSGTTPNNDVAILNFALNLEYIEAEFFLRATTGTGLTAADTGAGAGTVTGGTKVAFQTPSVQQYANELAANELAHVRFLRSTLGSAAIDRPAIDFTNGFASAATAAGIQLAGGAAFNPFMDENSFVLGSFTFVDLGVTAYHGAATLLTSKAYLTAAAGILATESYHGGAVRILLAYLGASPNTAQYLTYANQISALRGIAGGGMEAPVLTLTGQSDVISTATPSTNAVLSGSVIVPTDSNSIAFERTTDQVLHVAYLATKPGVVSKGGFFPNGFNGTITASAT